jgi:hypothetical protein
MRHEPVTSSRLQFTRDGRRLVVADPSGVSIVDVVGDVGVASGVAGDVGVADVDVGGERGGDGTDVGVGGRVDVAGRRDGAGLGSRRDKASGRCRRVAMRAQAIAAFADQVWVVVERISDGGLELVRLDIDGRVVASHAVPHAPDGVLVPTVVGPAAALWDSTLVVDDLGELVRIAAAADAAFPIAGRRWARVHRGMLVLPSGAEIPLGAASSLGGSAVFDGSSVAACVQRASGRVAIVAALASGRVVHALPIPSGPTRIATRRGIAAIRVAPRAIELVDLKFARSLGSLELGSDIGDFAIDPDGTVLAHRRTPTSARADRPGIETRVLADSVELISIAEALAPRMEPVVASDARPSEPRPSDTRPSDTRLSDTRPSETRPSDTRPAEPRPAEPRPAEPRPAEPRPFELFQPRCAKPPISREEALAALDRSMRSVALWTTRAIADAWDTRRLSYGNAGHHPYEHEVAALIGMNRGFAPEYVAALDEQIAAHELAIAPTPAMSTGALGALVEELSLSSCAADVLLVVAAPALHGEIARLYGILGNDPGRALVDALLVQQILAPRWNRYAVAAELAAHGPLVALGIVHVDPSRTRSFAALAIDPVVLARLCGEPPDLGPAPRVRIADRELGELELHAGALDRAIDALDRASSAAALSERGPGRLVVRGRAGSGRHAVIAALAAKAGRDVGAIDATQLPRDPERFSTALAGALRRAQLASLFPVVSKLEDVVFADRHGCDLARDVVRAHPGPLAIVAPPGALAVPGAIVIDIPALSETDRIGVWERGLARRGGWMRDVAGIAARYRVGPAVIERALAAAQGATAHDAARDATTRDARAAEPWDDRVEAVIREGRDVRLAGHARRVEHLASWSDLVLPPDVMDSLRELVGRVRHRRTVFETWGMASRLATSRGLTALFQGQPGTGKTLVAGVIARELGLDLYQVDLSKVMSKWLGETERNLSTIFDAAEDGQVILLFDEADSLFAKRTEVRSSNDRYANLEVNYLLQRLDAFEGVAILTTNNGGSIDPAFKRRMSFRLSFPFPDEDTRAQLWRAHLPPDLPRDGELVFDALARKYQLSGGYIRNACLRAAFLAAQEETALHQRHLERAVALEFAELGKLTASGSLD